MTESKTHLIGDFSTERFDNRRGTMVSRDWHGSICGRQSVNVGNGTTDANNVTCAACRKAMANKISRGSTCAW